MNKILAFSITILLVGLQTISAQNYQDYYETINKAEIAYLDKEYKKTDSLYQVAFGLVEKLFKEDYLLASINSEKIDENHKTYEYLKSGIFYGLTLKRIKKELSKFKTSDQWKLLKKEYKAIRSEYLNSINLKLREELLEMVKKDQVVRHPIFGSANKMKKTDNENYKRLLEIIKQNNGEWPSRFTIGDGNENGKYSFGEITIMLHHFSKEEVLNLKPYLVDAILTGGLSPYNVVYPLDYTNLKMIGKRGKYIDSCHYLGAYLSSNGNKAVICDCENAEKERKKIGLEPLDDYFRKRNSTYECYEENKK